MLDARSGLLAAILLLAPLLYGGNRPLALMLLELLALPLLFYVARAPQSLGAFSRPLLALLALALLLPLLQLIPLPWAAWSALPALQPYAQAITLAAQSSGASLPSLLPLSLLPAETERALLALLPPLLVFLAAVSVAPKTLRSLTTWLLMVAALQALIGLSQYAAGARASGTYANPDHLAGLLEMSLPLALALVVAHVGHYTAPETHQRGWRGQSQIWLSLVTSSAALYALLALVILLGLIFTKSRTGVVLAIVVLLISAFAFARRLGGDNVFGTVGTVSTAAVGVALAAGLVPVLQRFTQEDHLQDARWSIFAAMRDAVPAFLPFGSGIGTFREVFERYQPLDLSGALVNHAHNDYLEWLMEGGLIAAVIIAGLALTYLWRWPQLLTRGAWRTLHLARVGAGIGMLALLLHSLVDFNLRIPANQIVFAFLAALFFSQQSEAAPHEPEPDRPHAPLPTRGQTLATTASVASAATSAGASATMTAATTAATSASSGENEPRMPPGPVPGTTRATNPFDE